MEFSIEKYISNFVESQFPLFYQEEGPNFILFVKAYYEWLETSGNPIYEARSLQDYRDIDNTLEEFLEHFQKKYLYGIPFSIISNKRFLLKNILDVYRSKGTIQCYKLLFKLIYNQDVEIYLPGTDILKASDGSWQEPLYLELSDNGNLNSFVGKTIIGTVSGTTAVVESYSIEQFNLNKLNILYISNVLPKGGDFNIGETIVIAGQQSNTAATASAPTILGSLDSIQIINGGQNFIIGDQIKIAGKDPSSGQSIAYGVDGVVKVSGTSKGANSLTFNILSGGGGFLSNAHIFIYNGSTDTSGKGAYFTINPVISSQNTTYNTDLICDYMFKTLDATAYNFPTNATSNSANLSSTISSALNFVSNNFGSIGSFDIVRTGNGYSLPANVFVRSVQYSARAIANNSGGLGNVVYSTTSNTVTGTGTIFTSIFANGDVIHLRSNGAITDGSADQVQIIKQVVSDTSITLYGAPSSNSTSNSEYRAAPSIIQSQFSYYETQARATAGSLNGLNDNITSTVSSGNGIIGTTKIVNSGKGYIDKQQITAYLYSGVSGVNIISGGIGYSNGEPLVFSGGDPGTRASGYVNTDSYGTITSVTFPFKGSGYSSIPNVRVQTANGAGAKLTAVLTEFNIQRQVTGTIIKRGIGKGRGYWTTTRGFLNSDKYVQDSYYYQDYSYELKVASILDKYKNILYNTFHSSGSELFGKYLLLDNSSSNVSIFYSNNIANTTAPITYLSADITSVTSDAETFPRFTVKANTQGFSNTTDTLILTNANTYVTVGNRIYYGVPAGNTAITGLTGNTYYYVSFANSTQIAVSATLGGANVDITSANITSLEVHSIRTSITVDQYYIL